MELKSLFFKSSVQSFIVFVLGACCLLMVMFLFTYFNFYPNRFLNMKLTLLLILSNLPMKVISYLAVYLRAHKIEPYYIISAVNALLIAFSVLVIYPRLGLLSLFLSMNIAYWFILMPFSIMIYRSFNKSQKLLLNH